MTVSLGSEPSREQPVVAAAAAFISGGASAAEVLDALRRSVLYAQQGSSARPAAAVAMVDGVGTWIAIYSSVQRLVERVGECRWWSTTGADLLANVLPELMERAGLSGFVLDLGQPHQLTFPALLPVVAPAPHDDDAPGTRPATGAGDRELSGRWTP